MPTTRRIVPLSPRTTLGMLLLFLGGVAGLVTAVMSARTSEWTSAAGSAVGGLAALAFAVYAFAQQWRR
jgi:hypothetical protein